MSRIDPANSRALHELVDELLPIDTSKPFMVRHHALALVRRDRLRASILRDLQQDATFELLATSELDFVKPVLVETFYSCTYDLSYARLPEFDRARKQTMLHDFSCYCRGAPELALEMVADQVAHVWRALLSEKQQGFGPVYRRGKRNLAAMYGFLGQYIK